MAKTATRSTAKPVRKRVPRSLDLFYSLIENRNEHDYADRRMVDALRQLELCDGFVLVHDGDEGERYGHFCFVENGKVRVLFGPVYDERDRGPEYRGCLFGNIRDKFREHPNARTEA